MAALIAILISLWSLFYSHRSANASEAAVREAKRSADSAERAEQHAAASAAAETTQARIAEEKRKAELAPDLFVTAERYVAEGGIWVMSVQNIGPQEWYHVTLCIVPHSSGMLPPVTLSEGRDSAQLGSLARSSSIDVSLYSQRVGWTGEVRLRFELIGDDSTTPTVIIRSVRLN